MSDTQTAPTGEDTETRRKAVSVAKFTTTNEPGVERETDAIEIEALRGLGILATVDGKAVEYGKPAAKTESTGTPAGKDTATDKKEGDK